MRMWKFPVNVYNGSKTLSLPRGSVFRCIAEQYAGGPCVWVEVDEEQPIENRVIQVFGTGHNIPLGSQYIGTWQSPPFVWHLYEVTS